MDRIRDNRLAGRRKRSDMWELFNFLSAVFLLIIQADSLFLNMWIVVGNVGTTIATSSDGIAYTDRLDGTLLNSGNSVACSDR